MIDLLHSSKCIQLLYEIVLFSLRFQASIVTDDTSILYRANCIAFTRFYPFIDIVFLAIFSIQVVFVRFIHFSYSFTSPASRSYHCFTPPPSHSFISPGLMSSRLQLVYCETERHSLFTFNST